MSWSLGETKALSIKAARGIGRPWGMAEEVGFAVRWLQESGMPGVAALAGYLDWRDTCTVAHDLCPIDLGTAIMDTGRGVPEQLGLVRYPLLLAPFIAACVPSGMQLRWGETSLTLSEAGLVSDATREELLTEEAMCFAERAVAKVAESFSRVPADEAPSMARLVEYAARTYAPATDASRAGGAGSGLTDND